MVSLSSMTLRATLNPILSAHPDTPVHFRAPIITLRVFTWVDTEWGCVEVRIQRHASPKVLGKVQFIK